MLANARQVLNESPNVREVLEVAALGDGRVAYAVALAQDDPTLYEVGTMLPNGEDAEQLMTCGTLVNIMWYWRTNYGTREAAPSANCDLPSSGTAQQLRALGACSEARTWAKPYETLEAAWNACERGDWLLWLAGKLGLDRKRLVFAACQCARTALPRAKDDSVLKCIETTEAWTRGEVTLEQVRTARRGLSFSAAAYAAAYAADAYAAYAAAYSAAYAAAADAAAADAAALRAARLKHAKIVRGLIAFGNWATTPIEEVAHLCGNALCSGVCDRAEAASSPSSDLPSSGAALPVAA
jgi:hypothetical protein